MDFHLDSSFAEIAAILALATALGIAGQKLRQPLLIMFLAAGILAGPSALGLLRSHGEIELLASMGIALLLFIVGMRLDLHLIRTTGAVALATGVGQIAVTSGVGFVIAIAMGMNGVSAAYVAVALTFSSTIIIVKLLSDKKEIDSLHGRIAVGFLIVQDFAAIIALVALTTLGGALPDGGSSAGTMLGIAMKGALFLCGVVLLARFVLPRLLHALAHTQELLVLFAIAWAVLLGAVSDQLGFSKEVGAFLAGIAIASTEYRDAIGARLTSLRDFLLLFFFIDLGARLEWDAVGAQLGNALIFSLFVLAGNPLIVLAIMGGMGYRRRTSFLAGLTVAQISEFSLIVAALGVSLGHITPETMGLVTLVGVITIFASTYMILYSQNLYRLLASPLRVFERSNPAREERGEHVDNSAVYDAIILGLGSYGSALAEHLIERGRRIMAVDFDPQVLSAWRARGVDVRYGDAGDPEFHEHLPLGQTRWVVSTTRSPDLDLALLRLLSQRRYEGKIALAAVHARDVERYRAGGAHVVLQPMVDGAELAADALTQAMDVIPVGLEWPIGFREIRVKASCAHVGKSLSEIPLPTASGASILAVSRAGRVHYEPGSDFRLYPGDRLVLMAPPEVIREAQAVLEEASEVDSDVGELRFEATEVLIPPGATQIGRSLAELRFRETFGVTVAGLARGSERIFPGPDERLRARDVLVVIGLSEAIAPFKRQPWL